MTGNVQQCTGPVVKHHLQSPLTRTYIFLMRLKQGNCKGKLCKAAACISPPAPPPNQPSPLPPPNLRALTSLPYTSDLQTILSWLHLNMCPEKERPPCATPSLFRHPDPLLFDILIYYFDFS